MNVCFNGEFFPAGASLLPVQNRSYKWGDGIFETIKVYQGRVLLGGFHFERLFTSLQLLQIETSSDFTQSQLVQNIIELSGQNDCLASARIRLAVYRQDDNTSGYSIEALTLPTEKNNWVEVGQTLCLYPHARKGIDSLANIKSANYLPYVMAARFAALQKHDDAIVLNSQNNLCDTSKANIFLIKGNELYTPGLHQGCVSGIMRRAVIAEAAKIGYRVLQDEVREDDLFDAEEVFLTNAIQVIRWVKSYQHKTYSSKKTKELFDAVAATIFKS